ncbi:hypothetical protein [Serratia rhizosphaerae]|uniref:Uncharacterized protein n=1 Tax=Serratia rhizosphaerae TaxID=2597702 RepID=A0ABX6GTK9_9GAMM|nr:hypothetical protein [Serratia rhizosphaerae]QHA89570.1 hypothetical protein FO014_22705 [Serratia rhizosphaerae]
MTTQLEQQRQLQIAQERAQAIQPVTVTPNQGSVVPAVYQRNYVQEEMDKYPQITPPTEENIKKNMWIASGMVGLMAALATGNVAGGIAAGMVAAVGVHDHGFDLRQRAQYIRRLQEDGYSYPAILAWYKTGDNKELDKEREYMLQKDKFEEEKDEFTQTEEDKRLDREQRAKLERERMNNQMGIARMHEAGANARAAMQVANSGSGLSGLGHLNSFARGLLMPVKDTVVTLGKKQNYLDQLNTNLDLLEKGNPVARNAMWTAVAGLDNSNISPTEGAILRLAEEGGITQQMADWLVGHYSGALSKQTIEQFREFMAAHQEDVNMQRQRLFNSVYATANGELSAMGVPNAPVLAEQVAKQVTNGQVDESGGPQAPVIMTPQQQNASAQPAEGGERTTSNGVKYTVSKIK